MTAELGALASRITFERGSESTTGEDFSAALRLALDEVHAVGASR